jgi:hypothetical protein
MEQHAEFDGGHRSIACFVEANTAASPFAHDRVVRATAEPAVHYYSSELEQFDRTGFIL